MHRPERPKFDAVLVPEDGQRHRVDRCDQAFGPVPTGKHIHRAVQQLGGSLRCVGLDCDQRTLTNQSVRSLILVDQVAEAELIQRSERRSHHTNRRPGGRHHDVERGTPQWALGGRDRMFRTLHAGLGQLLAIDLRRTGQQGIAHHHVNGRGALGRVRCCH